MYEIYEVEIIVNSFEVAELREWGERDNWEDVDYIDSIINEIF